MRIPLYNDYNMQGEGQRCRTDLLKEIAGGRQQYGEADVSRGQKRLRSYLDAYSFSGRAVREQTALLRNVLLPALDDAKQNQYLRTCCGLEVSKSSVAKCGLAYGGDEKDFLDAMKIVKQECAALSQQNLESIKLLPEEFRAAFGVTMADEAIALMRIAYGIDSRRTQKLIQDVRAALGPTLGVADAAELKTSSQPSREEAAGALVALDAMTGLANAKHGLRAVLAQVELNKIHRSEGIASLSTSTNMVFSGPPGTGKTTAARLFAHAMKHAGALRTGQVVEVSRSDLVGEYIGQTEAKTRKALDSALGGVLFVDEAYTLMGKGQDFGPVALNEILSFMENNRRDICVIFAGYRDDIERLMDQNVGLRSRFNEHIAFDAYSVEELRTILQEDARRKGPYIIDAHTVRQVIPQCLPPMDSRGFANAREVRNLLERAIACRSLRLKETYLDRGQTPPRQALQILMREDFRQQ